MLQAWVCQCLPFQQSPVWVSRWSLVFGTLGCIFYISIFDSIIFYSYICLVEVCPPKSAGLCSRQCLKCPRTHCRNYPTWMRKRAMRFSLDSLGNVRRLGSKPINGFTFQSFLSMWPFVVLTTLLYICWPCTAPSGKLTFQVHAWWLWRVPTRVLFIASHQQEAGTLSLIFKPLDSIGFHYLHVDWYFFPMGKHDVAPASQVSQVNRLTSSGGIELNQIPVDKRKFNGPKDFHKSQSADAFFNHYYHNVVPGINILVYVWYFGVFPLD